LIKKVLGKDRLDETVSFRPGDVLYRGGDPADVLYLIQKGTLVSSVTAKGSPVRGAGLVNVYRGQRSGGDLVGTGALTDSGVRHCTVTCRTPVRAVAIPRKELLEIAEKEPLVGHYLAGQLRWRQQMSQEIVSAVERGVQEPQIMSVQGDGSDGASVSTQKNVFSDHMTAKSFSKGDVLLAPGKCDAFYIIDAGFVTVSYRKGDDSMVVAQLGPGDHFGEESIIGSTHKTIETVRCLTKAEVRVLAKSDFGVLGESGDTIAAFQSARKQRLSRRMRDLMQLASTYSYRDARGIRKGFPGIKRYVVKKGENLFAEGDIVEGAFYVHRGNFAGSKSASLGASSTHGLCDCIVDLNENRSRKYDETLVASQKSVVTFVPKSALKTLFSEYAYVSDALRKSVTNTSLQRRSSQSWREGKKS